jgi:hypothetical protein
MAVFKSFGKFDLNFGVGRQLQARKTPYLIILRLLCRLNSRNAFDAVKILIPAVDLCDAF